MEKNNKCVRLGFSRILWAVLAIVLCAAPCVRADVTIPAGEPCDIDYDVGGFLDVYGTANLRPGAYVAYILGAHAGSTVNIYGGQVDMYILVTTDEPAPIVNVYGTDFQVGGGPVIQPPNSVVIPAFGVLTGKYGDGNDISLMFLSDIPINLAAPYDAFTAPVEIKINGNSADGQIFTVGETITVTCRIVASAYHSGANYNKAQVQSSLRLKRGGNTPVREDHNPKVEHATSAELNVDKTLSVTYTVPDPSLLPGQHKIEAVANSYAMYWDPVGVYWITADFSGASDVLTFEVVTEEADTTVEINIEKAKVCWHHSDIHVEGKLYIPQGFWMDTLDRVGGVVTTLAGDNVVDQNVEFEIKGKDGKKWEYKDKENIDGPIKEFKIDWKGAKFDYKGDEGLHIHTHFIGGTETTLCIHSDDTLWPFTVTIDETTIEYDWNGDITGDIEGDDIDPQKDDNTHVHFTLPFELTSEMTIGVSGAIEITFNMADYYEEGFVKFKLVSTFDSGSFSGGSATSQDELECVISLGDMIAGSDLIGEEEEKSWTNKDDKHWDYK